MQEEGVEMHEGGRKIQENSGRWQGRGGQYARKLSDFSTEKRIRDYLMRIPVVKPFNVFGRQHIEFFAVNIIFLVAYFYIIGNLSADLYNYCVISIVLSYIQHVGQRNNIANIIGSFIKLHVNKTVLADRQCFLKSVCGMQKAETFLTFIDKFN